MIYKWIGKKIPEPNREAYDKMADEQIKRLQHYERGSNNVTVVRQGEEPDAFWQLWNGPLPQDKYEESQEWTTWFIDLSQAKNMVGVTYKRLDENDQILDQEERREKPLFFVYPSHDSNHVLDYDELESESLVLVCKKTGSEHRCYVWKGTYFTAYDDVLFINQYQFLNNYLII